MARIRRAGDPIKISASRENKTDRYINRAFGQPKGSKTNGTHKEWLKDTVIGYYPSHSQFAPKIGDVVKIRGPLPTDTGVDNMRWTNAVEVVQYSDDDWDDFVPVGVCTQTFIAANNDNTASCGQVQMTGVCQVNVSLADVEDTHVTLVKSANHWTTGGGGAGHIEIVAVDRRQVGQTVALVNLGAGGGGFPIFPVRMVQDGGSAGAHDQECQFTYSIYEYKTDGTYDSSDPIATTYDPGGDTRPDLGTMQAATFGIALGSPDIQGFTKILYMNEIPVISVCDGEGSTEGGGEGGPGGGTP